MHSDNDEVEAILFGSEDEMHISHDEGIAIVQLGPGNYICILVDGMLKYVSRSKIEVAGNCEERNREGARQVEPGRNRSHEV